ncbi:uncharacterized protein LOC127255102 [Andrographis paniculata]|uniref:uncharacterized protein LOC127255102 n=1 Tax=Andrographis paniculata TaxID=175694 RepID=UPI0021E8404A|nr:uncharacterized protein LOC127255102 [Andrographis paniculata]XP_051136440.1 uncharacterized protein LOC127255102 [Andrographis paniculata]
MRQQLLLAFKFLTLAGVYFFTRSRTPKHKLTDPDKSMVVVFLLEYLKRVLLYNAKLIRDGKSQVEILDNDIRLLKALLKDSARIRHKDEVVKEFIVEIRDVVRDGDDVIVGYLNQAAEVRARNFFQRAFGGQIKLIGVSKEVGAMRARVKNIFGRSKAVFAVRQIGPPPE